MNSQDRSEETQVVAAPNEGYAGQAVRLERRLGWILWSALVVLLVVISA